MLSVVLLLLAQGQLPLSTRVELPSGKVVNLAADYVDTVGAGEKISARGNVELSSGEMVVRSEELTYDAQTQQVVAKGNVRFFAFPYVGVADQVTVDVDGREASLVGGLFMKKKHVTLDQLTHAKSVEELKQLGDSDLLVTGTHIRQVDDDTFEVDDLSFTPCDCTTKSVSWRISAAHANVKAGERATLSWPVVYVKNVPVFALPWLYLPVSDRRSGFLIPKPYFTNPSGFSFEQPYFQTLGQSYDLTITPGYFFGNEQNSPSYGVRGPRLIGEFRYAPSGKTLGRVTLGVIDDFRIQRVPDGVIQAGSNPQRIAYAEFPTEDGGLRTRERGLRGEASLTHMQELGAHFYDRVDASVVSDGYYIRDLTADILAREAQYIRSTGVIYRRTDNTWAGLDVVLRQDVRLGYSLIHQDRDQAGNLLHGPNTIQRLPGLSVALPQKELWGPLLGSLNASLVRFAPLTGVSGDEGCDGVFGPPKLGDTLFVDSDGSQGNRKLDSCPVGSFGERQARMRLDFNPRLSANLSLGDVAVLSPYLALRQDAYVSEGNEGVAQRGYVLMGAQLSSELSRVYDWGGRKLRHAITPYTDFRFLPPTWGMVLGGVGLDEVDNARQPQRLLQAVTEIRQTLSLREGGGSAQMLRFDLGQDYQFAQLTAGDAYARFGYQYRMVSVNALARYDWSVQRFSQITGSARVDNGRGSALYLNYERLLFNGTDRMRSGMDQLFIPHAETRKFAEWITPGASVNFPFGLGAVYEMALSPSTSPTWRYMKAGISYGPACDCWRLEASAFVNPLVEDGRTTGLRFGGFSGSFTISHFGSFGSSG